MVTMTSNQTLFPEHIPIIVAGKELPLSEQKFLNYNPTNGTLLNQVSCANKEIVDQALEVAASAQKLWREMSPVKRGKVLFDICAILEDHADVISEILSIETGKILADAKGETAGAISLAQFFAGEGQRLFGRTLPSGIPNKTSATIRQPCGVAGLIVAANTPIANICWKVFPALICGNSIVLKASEDAPTLSWYFTKLLLKTELPDGCLNLIHGSGEETGSFLVKSSKLNILRGHQLLGRS